MSDFASLMSMILSVVVPVYNVEKYLPRCLDSLLRQGMKPGDWEVICVNDGSPDNSASILAEYEKKYPDIFKVITQENQGLGGARNTGTALAQGEYVTYLDSDDYLIDGAYRYLLEHFCQDKPDVLCYENDSMYTDGTVLHNPDAQPDGEITFEGDGMDAYNRWPLPHVWSKLYKRSFIEQYHIESQIVACQDEVFNFDVFRHHPRTRIVTSKVVHYELGNENSIQRTTDKKKVLQYAEDMFSNVDYMRIYLDSDEIGMKPAAMRNINNFLNVYHHKLSMAFIPIDKWLCFCQKMKKLPPYQPVLQGDSKNARRLAYCKKLAGKSFFFYIFFTFWRRLFYKCIRPLWLKE